MADTDTITTPPVRPFEDLDAGLYVHQQTPTTTITAPDGTQTVLVDVHAFMEVQRERDEMRRTAALINAWRLRPGRDEAALERLLASVGFSDADGRAMLSIVAQFRPGPR
jgi:hypothetical protein